MNDRIKEIRKSMNLSQDAFGKRLGITGASVSRLESGDREPSDQTVISICREFGIRRQWLEEGVGPMRQPETEDDEVVDAVLAGEDEFVKAVIRGIAKTPGGWEKMREVFIAIQNELDKQK